MNVVLTVRIFFVNVIFLQTSLSRTGKFLIAGLAILERQPEPIVGPTHFSGSLDSLVRAFPEPKQAPNSLSRIQSGEARLADWIARVSWTRVPFNLEGACYGDEEESQKSGEEKEEVETA